MMRDVVAVVVAVLCVVLPASSSRANLLKNPGFESSQCGGAENWNLWGNAAVETWYSPPEGTHAVFMRGSWGCEDDEGAYQTTDLGSILAGATYGLSASFYRADGWSAEEQYFSLKFFDAANNLLGGVGDFLECLPLNTWTKRTLSATAPANSSYAKVIVSVDDAGACGSLGADAFTLCAVPEPASVLTLCALGLGCLAASRKIRRWRPDPA
jgi:hypothetical protein